MRPPRRTAPSTSLTAAPGTGGTAIRSGRELAALINGQAPVDTTQLADVLKKLAVVMADYLENGKAIDITLNPVEILSAVEAALREADGQPSPWPDGADARTFFIHGLYDEIVQVPSNLFEIKTFPDGTERYIPVAKGLWKTCLETLRQQIVASGVKLGAKPNPRPKQRAPRPRKGTAGS